MMGILLFKARQVMVFVGAYVERSALLDEILKEAPNSMDPIKW